jgi:hypothetical protein
MALGKWSTFERLNIGHCPDFGHGHTLRRIFSGTSRFNFVSPARYTSPVPPAPKWCEDLVRPSLVPKVGGHRWSGLYKIEGQTLQLATGNSDRHSTFKCKLNALVLKGHDTMRCRVAILGASGGARDAALQLSSKELLLRSYPELVTRTGRRVVQFRLFSGSPEVYAGRSASAPRNATVVVFPHGE